MKGDYSRDTFDPLKSFARVLIQQGRVTLDSDLNEQASILLHYLQTLAADLIGPHGGPAASVGFEIELLPPGSTELDDMRISAGRYYVDGILCENNPSPAASEADPPATRQTAREDAPHYQAATHGGAPALKPGAGKEGYQRAQSPDFISFFEQPDYPLSKQSFDFPDAPFLVFLDVWERHITALEDPDIQEVALGGPDTSARAKIVWQVKLINIPENAADITCSKFNQDALDEMRLLLEPGERPMLKARTKKNKDINALDPCTLAPDARYRGEENQLYRVEIHRGGKIGETSNGPTFKWSRDNGSNVYPILKLADEIVTLGSTGRDDLSSLDVGDWVEIVDDDSALMGGDLSPTEVPSLYQVVAIPDPLSMQVTLSDAPPIVIPNADKHPLLRRWDQQTETDPKTEALQRASDNAALIIEGSGETAWLELEDGIQIQFQADATYRPGDYWLIPARTATGDIEWPKTGENPDALPPRGVTHHYAPLAVVFLDGGIYKQTDLRKTWGYLAQCSDCPVLKINSPASVPASSPITFTVALNPSPQGATLAYEWSIESGTISGGQGTPSITVDTTGLSDEDVKATVKISGLAEDCPDSASRSTHVQPSEIKTAPSVTVTGPVSVRDGDIATYTSVVKNFATTGLKYVWTISPAGTKVTGANEPTLKADSKGLAGRTIEAILVVSDNLGNRKADSARTLVQQNPTITTPVSETAEETPSASKKRSPAGRRGKSEDKA